MSIWRKSDGDLGMVRAPANDSDSPPTSWIATPLEAMKLWFESLHLLRPARGGGGMGATPRLHLALAYPALVAVRFARARRVRKFED
jgi:hypothetical protein